MTSLGVELGPPPSIMTVTPTKVPVAQSAKRRIIIGDIAEQVNLDSSLLLRGRRRQQLSVPTPLNSREWE